MDWFEKITGFRELDYDETRTRLHVADSRLHSRYSARRYGVGVLETPSLAELRARAVHLLDRTANPLRVTCASGDVRRMHADPSNERALFQVASQFNLLEMPHPRVTPEQGVTAYESTERRAQHARSPRAPRPSTATTSHRSTAESDRPARGRSIA